MIKLVYMHSNLVGKHIISISIHNIILCIMLSTMIQKSQKDIRNSGGHDMRNRWAVSPWDETKSMSGLQKFETRRYEILSRHSLCLKNRYVTKEQYLVSTFFHDETMMSMSNAHACWHFRVRGGGRYEYRPVAVLLDATATSITRSWEVFNTLGHQSKHHNDKREIYSAPSKYSK